MAGWSDQIRDIGHDLVNIEINTIEADGILGRKMPSFPHALIDIAQKYGDYLGAYPICLNLDGFAETFAQHMSGNKGDAKIAEVLAAVPDRAKNAPPPGSAEAADTAVVVKDEIAPMRSAPVSFTEGPHQYSFNMTSGPNTFEMLRWAARRVLDASEKGARAAAKIASTEEHPDVLPALNLEAREVAVARRIHRTSDQLKTIAGQLHALGYGEYIGKSRWELLQMKEPRKAAPPELLSRIRKAWDIGVDHIALQTVVQLDGDVIFRAAPGALKGDYPLLSAHESVTNVGLSHWKGMFDTIIDLLSRGVDRLFGTGGSSDSSESG